MQRIRLIGHLLKNVPINGLRFTELSGAVILHPKLNGLFKSHVASVQFSHPGSQVTRRGTFDPYGGRYRALNGSSAIGKLPWPRLLFESNRLLFWKESLMKVGIIGSG